MAPEEAQESDLLCSEVPSILRMIDYNQYCLVGEHYLRGIMDDEVMKDVEEDFIARLCYQV